MMPTTVAFRAAAAQVRELATAYAELRAAQVAALDLDRVLTDALRRDDLPQFVAKLKRRVG